MYNCIGMPRFLNTIIFIISTYVSLLLIDFKSYIGHSQVTESFACVVTPAVF